MTNIPAGIHPDVFYPLDQLQVVAKVGPVSLRNLKRRGLRVYYHGRVGYVEGKDLIERLKENSRPNR